MKVLIKLVACLSIILLLVQPKAAEAQQVLNGNIAGTITSEGKPLGFASVILKPLTDTTKKQQAISGQNGVFTFKNLAAGPYRIVAVMIGCARFESEIITVSAGTTKNLPVVLKPEVRELAEVKVRKSQPVLSVKNGTIAYDIKNSPSASGMSALDVLRGMPGVSIDQNDNLLLKGSSALNVMIDGKMTYVSGRQLNNMLRGMTSAGLQQIEITEAPSAEYDASGTAGLINIVTKKNKQKGYAIDLNSSMGGGRYFLQRYGINGSLQTKYLNINGGFGYDFRHDFYDRFNANVGLFDGDVTRFTRKYSEAYRTHYYTYKLGADIFLTKKASLGINYSGFFDDWSKRNGGLTILQPGTGGESRFKNTVISIEPYFNNVINVNYQYKPDTLGTLLSAAADYINYQNNSDGYISNQLISPPANKNYQQLNYHQPNLISIRSAKLDAVIPYKKLRLKTGFKYADIKIDNAFRFDSLLNGIPEPASSLSDHFFYSEKITAGYVSATRQWKKNRLEAGVRIERTQSQSRLENTGLLNQRKYTDIFPSVNFEQTISESQRLSVSLARRINRPNYSDLNPVRFFGDKYSYYSGNPQLLPEKSWIGSVTYTWLDKYTARLTYNRLNNFIARFTEQESSTGILVTQNANFPHQDRINLMLIFPGRVNTVWDISSTSGFNYTFYPIQQQEGQVVAKKLSVDLLVNQHLHLPWAIDLELNSHYTSPELYGIYLTRYYFQQDAGIKKSVWNKRIDLTLSLSDIFHTNRYWGTSVSNLINYNYKTVQDTRRIFFTATYHLGGNLNVKDQNKTEEENRF